MKSEEYLQYDATSLAELVRTKQVTPMELLNCFRNLLDCYNPKLNAVTSRLESYGEEAISRGLPEGPFTGVPFLLKDLGSLCKDTITTHGSRAPTFLATYDSEIITRYRRAGLVIAGKTNVPELGLSFVTESLALGTCRNPWDLARTPGGSSGGTASAVAARILPMADASDGGGSIRVPAAACGLFGLKPTRGRNPVGPDVGEAWGGLACSHVITRSVRDSARMLDAISGPEIGAPNQLPKSTVPFIDAMQAPPKKLRIGFTTNLFSELITLAPECAQAVHYAAKLCERLGHQVEEATPEVDAQTLNSTFQILASTNIRMFINYICQRRNISVEALQLEVPTEIYYEYGKQFSAEEYARAVWQMHIAARKLCYFFQHYDVLLTPALAKLPVKIGELGPLSAKTFDDYLKKQISFSPYTGIFNQTGTPAMTLPVLWTENNLPVSVQFVADFAAEATLLNLAHQLETINPWVGKLPDLLSA